jgi:hypothetical protein
VQSRAADAERAGAAAGLGAGQVGALEAVVAAAARDVDARLMAVLWERQALGRHCDALRRYVLLGQVCARGARQLGVWAGQHRRGVRHQLAAAQAPARPLPRPHPSSSLHPTPSTNRPAPGRLCGGAA